MSEGEVKGKAEELKGRAKGTAAEAEGKAEEVSSCRKPNLLLWVDDGSHGSSWKVNRPSWQSGQSRVKGPCSAQAAACEVMARLNFVVLLTCR